MSTVSWLAEALGCAYGDLLEGPNGSDRGAAGGPRLTPTDCQTLERIARSAAVSGGVEAMQFYRASHRAAATMGEGANPATDADVRASVAVIRSLASEMEVFTKGIGRRYCLYAEELDSNASAAVRQQVDSALAAMNLGHHEIARSPAALAKGMETHVSCIFDGLDGTANFRANLPFFCCAVAIFDGEIPVVAAIYDPIHHMVYSGYHSKTESEGEAWMWDISGGGRWALADMSAETDGDILATHLTTNAEKRREFLPVFEQIGMQFGRITMLNSGQLALANVAAGRFTAFVNNTTSIWDTAAGDVLVRARGGRVTDFDGNAIDYRSGSSKTAVLAAGSGESHDVLLGLVEDGATAEVQSPEA